MFTEFGILQCCTGVTDKRHELPGQLSNIGNAINIPGTNCRRRHTIKLCTGRILHQYQTARFTQRFYADTAITTGTGKYNTDCMTTCINGQRTEKAINGKVRITGTVYRFEINSSLTYHDISIRPHHINMVCEQFLSVIRKLHGHSGMTRQQLIHQGFKVR